MSKSKDVTDVQTDVVNAGGQRPPAYRLTVLAGVDAGQTATLDASNPSGVLIGQGPACGLRLADRAVTRRHASLDLDLRGARLVDLGSTNGTRVNGVRIEAAFLRGGELIELGATQLRLDAYDPGSALHTPAGVRFGRVLGASLRMRRIYPLCARVAQAAMP